MSFVDLCGGIHAIVCYAGPVVEYRVRRWRLKIDLSPGRKGAEMSVDDNRKEPFGSLHSPLEPHGQAALLLVESLIHGLIEQAALTNARAIDIVETALEVQASIAEVAGAEEGQLGKAHALLTAIAETLKCDRDP